MSKVLSDSDKSRIYEALMDIYANCSAGFRFVNLASMFKAHKASYSYRVADTLERMGLIELRASSTGRSCKWIGPPPSMDTAEKYVVNAQAGSSFTKATLEKALDQAPTPELKVPVTVTDFAAMNVAKPTEKPKSWDWEVELSTVPAEVMISELRRRGFTIDAKF